MKDDLRATVVITGYPDVATPERERERLATQRAENAKEYLVTRHGIEAGRISIRTETASPGNETKAVVTVTFSSR